MTAFRWVSVIIGFLNLCRGYSTDPNPPNIADVFIVIILYGISVILIGLPLILEFLERKENKNK